MKIKFFIIIALYVALISFVKSLKISYISVNDHYIIIQNDTIFSNSNFVSYRLDSLKSFRHSDVRKMKSSNNYSQSYFLPKNGIIFYSPIKNGKSITSISINYGEKLKGINSYTGKIQIFDQSITSETVYKELITNKMLNKYIDSSYINNDLKSNGLIVLKKNRIVVSILFINNSENSKIKSVDINL